MVAAYYLENYLGWFRALDRMPSNPHDPRNCWFWLSAAEVIIS